MDRSLRQEFQARRGKMPIADLLALGEQETDLIGPTEVASFRRALTYPEVPESRKERIRKLLARLPEAVTADVPAPAPAEPPPLPERDTPTLLQDLLAVWEGPAAAGVPLEEGSRQRFLEALEAGDAGGREVRIRKLLAADVAARNAAREKAGGR